MSRRPMMFATVVLASSVSFTATATTPTSAPQVEAPVARKAPVPFARDPRNPAQLLLVEWSRLGLTKERAAKALASGEGMLFFERKNLLRQVGDFPMLAQEWAAEAVRHPKNMEASIGEALALRELGLIRQALEVVERGLAHEPATLDPASVHLRMKQLLPLRCELHWQLGRLDEALQSCGEAARASPLSTGALVLGKLHLKKGEDKNALTYLTQAIRRCSWCGSNLFHYANALQRTGALDDARYAWGRAIEAWPDYTPAHEVLQNPALPLDRRFAAEESWQRQQSAAKLARCGRVYLGLGVQSRAEACFAAAERVEPGASAAERVAFAHEASPDAARSLAAALVKKHRHPGLLALMAELELEVLPAGAPRKKVDPVFAMLIEAERKAPVSYDTARTWMRACSQFDHSGCAVDRRGRLRFGTSREEQHATPAQQMDSRYLGYTPPQFTSFEILPLGMSRLDELVGLVDTLSARFPALTFRILDPQPLPEEVTNHRGQVVFEFLLPKLPGRKGTLALVEQDFTGEGSNFLFSTWDGPSAQGAASVNRFRGTGDRTDPRAPLTPEQLEKSRQRIANQLTSTIAKLLGMSFPCRAHKCVLQFPRSVPDHDAKGGDFCEHHQKELARFSGR